MRESAVPVEELVLGTLLRPGAGGFGVVEHLRVGVDGVHHHGGVVLMRT
jgi:hypothetical protein